MGVAKACWKRPIGHGAIEGVVTAVANEVYANYESEIESKDLGEIVMAHMAKEHISMDELERALREHSINSYHDVALAVLEVDGSISCLKYEELNPASHNHLVRHKYLQEKQ